MKKDHGRLFRVYRGLYCPVMWGLLTKKGSLLSNQYNLMKSKRVYSVAHLVNQLYLKIASWLE